MSQNQPEVWQRGPVKNIPALLQPVAHALLQATEELQQIMANFPDPLLWERPAGVASPAFHLLHVRGVLDRLFTYAKGASLTSEQLDYLKTETAQNIPDVSSAHLLEEFRRQVDRALVQLENTDETTLTDFRGLGRKQIPTTVLGLLFHTAEHIMRHVGQLNVTVRILT